MITKERLKELIKQGATIYNVCWYNVYEEKLGSNHFVGIADDEISLMQRYNGYERELIDHAKNLFETKEEAEWFAEFGDVERTERLELPTWEEVNQDIHQIYFTNPELQLYRLSFYCGLIEIEEQDYDNLEVFRNLETYKLTKENYILVCRKAKELFLGEKM